MEANTLQTFLAAAPVICDLYAKSSAQCESDRALDRERSAMELEDARSSQLRTARCLDEVAQILSVFEDQFHEVDFTNEALVDHNRGLVQENQELVQHNRRLEQQVRELEGQLRLTKGRLRRREAEVKRVKQART